MVVLVLGRGKEVVGDLDQGEVLVTVGGMLGEDDEWVEHVPEVK